MHTPKLRTAALAAALLSSSALSFGAVTIYTDFSDKNGGQPTGPTFNSWTGTAGNGWLGKWNPNITSGSSWSHSANTGALVITHTMTADGTKHLSINRSYDATLLDFERDYTISFDITLNTLTNFNTGDYIGILEGGANTRGLPSESEFWGVQFDGADGVLKWYDAKNQTGIASGLSFTTGSTYSFTISIDPVARTWVGTVTSGATTITSTAIDLGMGTLNANRVFRLHSQIDGPEGSYTSVGYTFDNLTIHQADAPIPEASSFALLAGATALGFGACGRRRRGA
jgi:hypothetical protein